MEKKPSQIDPSVGNEFQALDVTEEETIEDMPAGGVVANGLQ